MIVEVCWYICGVDLYANNKIVMFSTDILYTHIHAAAIITSDYCVVCVDHIYIYNKIYFFH